MHLPTNVRALLMTVDETVLCNHSHDTACRNSSLHFTGFAELQQLTFQVTWGVAQTMYAAILIHAYPLLDVSWCGSGCV